MVRINIEVKEEFRKKVKRKALESDMTLKEYVIKAIKEKMNKED